MERQVPLLGEIVVRPMDVDHMDALFVLFGANDQHVSLIEQECDVSLSARGSELILQGEPENVELAQQVLERLSLMANRGDAPDKNTIRYAIALAREGRLDAMDEMMKSVVAITHRGKPIRCKTLGQYEYVHSIREHPLTFAVGPAGTGKTYLAMAMAVVALKSKEVERIVLTRPAVEAGEKLGFLPGDMSQKVDPYLRPLYDALFDMMGGDAYQRLVERGIVEIAPLAYMRGRTLSNSFIILDEAQNTTSEQMKMFLTRFGSGSKIVVTGDITQTDLPFGKKSGLAEALEVLADISSIAIHRLTYQDVVRHELVQEIAQAYDRSKRKETLHEGKA